MKSSITETYIKAKPKILKCVSFSNHLSHNIMFYVQTPIHLKSYSLFSLIFFFSFKILLYYLRYRYSHVITFFIKGLLTTQFKSYILFMFIFPCFLPNIIILFRLFTCLFNI